jgi:polysaccharide chain length determinant protein (PEP-CTERM system associated)
MLPQKFDIDYCWRAFLRRKWYVAVPFFLILAGGIGYALSLPKIYMASATILVQRQTLPAQYVRSNITESIRERIGVVQAKVTSRPNLEDLIDELGLYTSDDPSKPEMSMQAKVATMGASVKLQLPRRGQFFKISFTHKNPQKAMEVTNALTLDIIQEHLRQQEAESVGTTEFLESELLRVERLLQEKELALTTYKQKHLGGLPDNLSTNLAIRGQILQKIDSIERSLDQAQSQKLMLQAQLAEVESSTSFDLKTPSDTDTDITTAPDPVKLKEALRDLLLRYTENHPDVIRLKRRIARLEEEQKAAPFEKQGGVGDNILATEGDFPDNQLGASQLEMTSINRTIKKLQADKVKLERESSHLDKLIANVPLRRLDLISLERDYNAIKQQYNSLLSKKLNSDLVASMEKQEKGTQFKVVNPANLPRKPFSPDIPRIILMAAIAGLIVGFALGLGMEFFDQTFRNHKELNEILQLPVLAIIPKLKTTSEANRKRRRKAVALYLTGFLVVALSIGVWFWTNGNVKELLKKIRSIVPT